MSTHRLVVNFNVLTLLELQVVIMRFILTDFLYFFKRANKKGRDLINALLIFWLHKADFDDCLVFLFFNKNSGLGISNYFNAIVGRINYC
jgi:hypothetical protein